MKKVVLSAFAFAMFGVATVNAQTTPQSQSPTTTQKQTQDTTKTSTPTAPATATTTEETKTLVTVEELPAAVKTTLASPSLKVWTPYEAYLVKEKDGDEYFAINIKKDTQTGSVKLDKEGKPVK